MKRREFMLLLGGAAAGWPLASRAQGPTKTDQAGGAQIGQVATVQGIATVKRSAAAVAIALQVNDLIFKNDTLQTGANSSLGVTFDDETTFSLSANSEIVIDEFVYQEDGNPNSAAITAARGTVAFVASLVAKTGDMKIATPGATLGIRGTTGVIDVPEGGAAGAGEARIKLYPDTDGHVGRIEVFNPQGGRLGILTQGASAFALRTGAGGRLEAVPFRIPPQEAARDRGVLQRLFVSHAIGRRMTIERRRSRGPNQQHPNNPRRPGGPQPRNTQPHPGGPRPPNRAPGGPGRPSQQPRKPPRGTEKH